MARQFEELRERIALLREFYLQYETQESKRRKKILKGVVVDLRGVWEVNFLLCGSLEYGMSVAPQPNARADCERVGSDFDFQPLIRWRNDSQKYDHLLFDVYKRIEQKLGYCVDVETRRFFDLGIIEKQVKVFRDKAWKFYSTLHFNSALEFYRHSQFHPGLDSSHTSVLENIERNVQEFPSTQDYFLAWMNPVEILDPKSLTKYNKRLQQRGILIPKEIQDIGKDLYNRASYKDD